MGVPGAVFWILLNALVVRSLWSCRRRARKRGDASVEGLAVVLFCYWLLFTVISATDVLLEGPYGGIWFWTVAGLAVALGRMEFDATRPPGRRRLPEEEARSS